MFPSWDKYLEVKNDVSKLILMFPNINHISKVIILFLSWQYCQVDDIAKLTYRLNSMSNGTVGKVQKEDCNLLIYTAFGVYIIPAFIAFLLWFLIRHVTEKLIHCPRHDVRDEKKAMPRPNDLQNILVKNAAIDTGLFLTYFRFNSIHIYIMCHIIWVI